MNVALKAGRKAGRKKSWPELAALLAGVLAIALIGVSCSDNTKAAPTKTEITVDPNLYTIEHPELFKLARVETRELPSTLTANGTVTPDVNRTIHVTSQGSGRVVELKVRLGDYVNKGELLLTVRSTDLASAFSDYQKAVADERLAQKALDRAQMLYSHGALAEKDLQLAEDTTEKAKVDTRTADQHVRILGGDPAHPGSLIELRAPVAGTIVEQNVSGFEGIKSLDNTPNLFTIADLSQVWVVCDVFENDLGEVHVGDAAEIRFNAYPDKGLQRQDCRHFARPRSQHALGQSAHRAAERDGSLRPGMFAVATFRSRKSHRGIVDSLDRHHAPARQRLGLPQRGDQPIPPGRGAGLGATRRTACSRSATASKPGTSGHQRSRVLHRSDRRSRAKMIRYLIDFALRNRLLVLGVALVLFVWGIISFHNLPIEAYPDVADTYAQVITQWPGHAAEEVEQQITVPLEVNSTGWRTDPPALRFARGPVGDHHHL